MHFCSRYAHLTELGFWENTQISIFILKSIQWEPNCSMWTHEWTDGHYEANAPRKQLGEQNKFGNPRTVYRSFRVHFASARVTPTFPVTRKNFQSRPNTTTTFFFNCFLCLSSRLTENTVSQYKNQSHTTT